MTALVIVGAQWGDEGKGKVVDLLAAHADAVVRYGGGANAGHTLVVGDEKVVFHLVPSGALHARPRCWLGTGMVIDPRVLVDELAVMRARGVLDDARVLVSDRAQLVLPQHFLVDALREQGPSAIGTTKRGIGPAYQDRAARRGLRMIDWPIPTVSAPAWRRTSRAGGRSSRRWAASSRTQPRPRSATWPSRRRSCPSWATSAARSTTPARRGNASCSKARRGRCSTSTTAPTPS